MIEARIARRLRASGIAAVAAIALVAIVQTVVLDWRFTTSPVRASTFEQSGLRLAQTYAILAYAAREPLNSASRAQLQTAISGLTKTQSRFDDLHGPDLDVFWRYIRTANAVAAGAGGADAVRRLFTLAPVLSDAFDRITRDDLRRDNAQRTLFRIFVLLSGIATLAVLALLYFLVMRRREAGIVEAVSAVEQRRQRFQAMFDNSSELMALYNPDGTIVRANRAAITRLGFGADVLGKHFRIHVTQRDFGPVSQEFAKAAAGSSAEFSATFLDANNREIPVIANLTPIIVRGNVVGVAGAARERRLEALLWHSRERFRSLFSMSIYARASVDAEGIVTDMNAAMTRLTGYGEGELVGRDILVLALPGNKEGAKGRLAETLRGKTVSYEAFIRTKAGADVAVEVDMTPIVVEARVEGAFITLHDKTNERAMSRRFGERDALSRALLEIAGSPFEAGAQIDFALLVGARTLGMDYGYVTRFRGNELTIERRFGPDDYLPVGHTMPVTSFIGGRLAANSHAVALDDLSVEPFAGKLANHGYPWRSYIGSRIDVDRSTYGTLVFFDRTVRTPPFEQAHIDFVDVLSSLISSAIMREIHGEELRELAVRDPLTGLPNRSMLRDHFGRMVAHARRTQTAVAVHYLDLDAFKPINDAYGHEAGDEVLRAVADRLRIEARGEDVVSRIGGDEFVVLQAGADDASIVLFDRRLQRALDAPIELSNGAVVRIGATVGVARYPEHGEDLGAVLRASDADMYRKKRAKRSVS